MKIIITGAYAIGTFPAKLLSQNNEDITLIDQALRDIHPGILKEN